MTFGDRLKELRERKNMKQNEIANILGIHNSTLTKYESGERNPDFETLIQISSLLEVTIDYLLKGDINEVRDSFGSRIKKLRTDRKWTQEQFAERLDVTAQVISNYERDYREPEFSTLIKIAKLFKVTTDYLLGYEVEK